MAFDISVGSASFDVQISAGTQVVSGAGALSSALKAAAPGDTIYLAGGSYGDLRLESAWQFNFPDGVTLAAADPTDPPVFNTITLNGVDGVTLSGLEVNWQPTASTMAHDSAVRAVNSSNVTFEHMTIAGNPAVNGVPQSSAPNQLDATGNILGLATGNGLTLTGSQNITVTNSDISQFRVGIRTSDVDGLTVTDNEIHDLRMTPIGGADTNNVLIDNNYVHSFHPWNFGGAGDHGDFVHFWTDPKKQSVPSSDFVITNNFFDDGTGSQSILGIYMDDNGNGLGFENVLIDNNVIRNGDPQGIRFENVHNSQITNNTLLGSSDVLGTAPGLNLLDGTDTLLVQNNILSFVSIYGGADASSISQINNIEVQRVFPDQPNYYTDLFVNGLADNPTLADLQALPGSLAATFGGGAQMTVFDTAPSTEFGLIHSTTGQALTLNHVDIDLAAVFGPTGTIGLNGATIQWDLGDGNTGSGQSVQHVYSAAGHYDVTAQITLASGQTVTAQKTVVVNTPIALAATFENGVQDLSDIRNPAQVSGPVQFVQDGGSTAMRLNGGHVAFKNSAELLDNQSFTLLLDFRKEQLSDTGALLTFPGSLSIYAEHDQILAGVTTSSGTTWLKPSGIGLNDTAWHQMALTFSSGTGEILIYLDGTEIGRASGLDGDVQRGLLSHDFALGSPWSAQFGGLFDNLYFLKGALNAGQVAQIANGTETVSSILNLGINNPGSLDSGTSVTGSISVTSGTGNTAPDTGGSGDTTPDTGGSGDTTPDTGGSGDTTPDTGGSGDTTPDTGGSGDTTPDTGGTSDTTPDTGGTSDTTPDTGGTSDTTPDTGGTSDTTPDTGGSGDTTPDTGGPAVPNIYEDTDRVVIDGIVTSNQVVVDTNGGRIGVDTDGDGTMEQGVTLTGDFSGGEFVTTYSPTTTMISFHKHLTSTSNAQNVTSSAINGIANQAYLNGDTSRNFVVDIQHNMADAGFNNSLGVYQFDDAGNISEVRVIANSVQSTHNSIVVEEVEAGMNLGFFIIQNGFNRLDQATLSSNNLSLEVRDGAIKLMDAGSVVKKAKIFVSHDSSLNFDGGQHVISGTDPDASGGFLIGFEDQTRNHNSDDDFQDVVFLVQAEDMMAFA